jgi:hypothetical protein
MEMVKIALTQRPSLTILRHIGGKTSQGLECRVRAKHLHQLSLKKFRYFCFTGS